MSSKPSTLVFDLTPMTAAQAKALVRRLLGSYPSANLTDPDIYITSVIAILCGYPLWAGEKAIAKIVETSKFVPAIAEIKPVLEDHVKAHRYAKEFERDASRMIEDRSEQRAIRPTYEELKAKYGPNWGIGQEQKKHGFPELTLEQVREKYGAEKVDAVPHAADDGWKKLKSDFAA